MNERPSPEALLQQAAREGQGRLKLFLGAAPGVGKTYAMLRAAQRRRSEGVDVCVGLIETHGRSETEAQLAGLELLPRRQVPHRGRAFAELDVDAIVARRPQLVLVDEFAHSNVPGSPHPKRHQDIDDLLAAGIDVWSTLNVQHIESLNDVVARITGVEVRETVPDAALARADEIELIDLPPEDLIQRLRDGKVYVPEQARQALHQFFGRGALTALRELAMRVAAERVDAQLLEYKQVHGVGEVWPTRERLLVAVDDADIGQAVIRAARRIAENRRLPWLAIHVETSRMRRLPAAARERIERNLRFAERMGASVLRVQGDNLADELIRCATRENASQIVVGRPLSRRWKRLWSTSVAQRLIERANSLEVTVVTWQARPASSRRSPMEIVPQASALQPYALATLASALVTGVLLLADRTLPRDTAAMLYLLATAIMGTRFGVWPSIYCAALNFLCFNFFFSEPYYTLTVANATDVRSLISFFVIAVITGNLGGRLHDRIEAQRMAQRRAEALARLGERLAGATERRDVVAVIGQHLLEVVNMESVVMLPDGDGRLLVLGGSTAQRPLDDGAQAAANWSLGKQAAAGWDTDTLPNTNWMFLPLVVSGTARGVLGLRRAEGRETLTGEERAEVESTVDLAAVALERTLLVEQIEGSRVMLEAEQLRGALLSSVSHELRTPLATVLGAAGTLVERDARLTSSERGALALGIVEEAERLDRLVQNLLDMTRLGYGDVRLRRDWCDLRDLVAAAQRRLARGLAGRRLEVRSDNDLPLLWVDAVLIEQVLVNLLDNAIKYSSPASMIALAVQTQGASLQFRVIDQGVGIPQSERMAVFDMFHRARAGDSRVPGTGLGLAICRGFVEAHGGHIRAEGAPEGGTSMVVELPLAPRPPTAPDDRRST